MLKQNKLYLDVASGETLAYLDHGRGRTCFAHSRQHVEQLSFSHVIDRLNYERFRVIPRLPGSAIRITPPPLTRCGR
jgi:hypothetical protein